MIRNLLVKSVHHITRGITMGLLVGSVSGLGQSAEPVKWGQPPDPTGWDVNITKKTLADDFLCNQTGPITDIHIWTSFKDDVLPTDPYSFAISIWTDIPQGPNVDFSHPGELLKQWTLDPVNIEPIVNTSLQGWYDPLAVPPDVPVIPQDHVNMQRYDFLIPQGQEVWQTQGNIYWLSVQATPTTDTSMMGWKTTDKPWNDDATVWDWQNQVWLELRDPLEPVESLNLAFEITTTRSVAEGGITAMFLLIGIITLSAFRCVWRD